MAPPYLESLASSLEASLEFLQPLSAYIRAPLAKNGAVNINRSPPPPPFNFTDLEFEGCLLQGFSLSKCTIKNCKLVNCTLQDSEMMRSLAVDCTIRQSVRIDCCLLKRSTIANTLLRRCLIEACKIYDVPNILDSQLIDCRLSSDGFQTYSGNDRNEDWIIQLFNCEIQSARFRNITAHENNKISNSNDCKIVKTPLAFINFPTEIRNLIFLSWIESLLLHMDEQPNHLRTAFNSLQTVPPLVLALRGDQKLYNEVLEVVYTKAIIPLGDRRDQHSSTSLDMVTSSMALNRVKRLSLNGTWRNSMTVQEGTRLQEQLQNLQNVQEIYFDICLGSWEKVTPQNAIRFAFKMTSTCLQHLHNVRKLVIRRTEEIQTPFSESNPDYEAAHNFSLAEAGGMNAFDYAMKKVDAVLGVESTKWVDARAHIKWVGGRDGPPFEQQTWNTIWEAKNGQALAWKWNAACADPEIEGKLKRLAEWSHVDIDSDGFVKGAYQGIDV